MPASVDNIRCLAWILSLSGLYWFATSFFLAKRSLSTISQCHEASTLLRDYLQVEVPSSLLASDQKGCWTDRQVDSMVVVVVDALRFDFALYDLPESVGRRIFRNDAPANSTSRLLQFVADPPTVTYQRLKALTTGGLPTFADLSANFGGGHVEDDSWIRLLANIPATERGIASSKIAFVGDDTWIDLYEPEIHIAYPYPSFNTRDLNTVDNGCLQHIPEFLSKLRTSSTVNSTAAQDEIELMIVHFLGVDHVGHTYGPHNQHMDAKLRQMDYALSSILQTLEESHSCHATFIFGDHGMTEDGNHGGGTEEEINAALFMHSTAGCGRNPHPINLEKSRVSDLTKASFESIHQIDLVPTISLLLGLPIPYANLGSLVPTFLPNTPTLAHAATALALNAAQVYRYLSVYSETATRLQGMDRLQRTLSVAASTFRKALAEHANDDEIFLQVATEFKLFLLEALETGQRAWTRFDDQGMLTGICILSLGLVTMILCSSTNRLILSFTMESVLVTIFTFYQCGLLSFSNSYILEEDNSLGFELAVLCITLSTRIRLFNPKSTLWLQMLLLPITSRIGALLVSGHGQDPSLGQHFAHYPMFFILAISILITMRYKSDVGPDKYQATLDSLCLIALGSSWWEKAQIDESRNGYFAGRTTFICWCIGVLYALVASRARKTPLSRPIGGHTMEGVSKLLIIVMLVTGPSSACSCLIFCLEAFVLLQLSQVTTVGVSSFTIALLWKLLSRHTFFATNHGCAFNRLQYSSAFILTEDFNFVLGGISLFLNTFGWEVATGLLVWQSSRHKDRAQLWNYYCGLQLFETLASCISVSILRRHLMVWDIYAPHFLWISIFTILLAFVDLFNSITG